MTKSKESYNQIIKSTSIFGGVQVFNILTIIIRSKVIAELLGPMGMGIVSLLQSSIGLIESLTNFGLARVSVKNVAEAVESKNLNKVSLTVSVLKKLIWITGLLGSVTVFFTASWLSEISFESNEYQLIFKWISITLLFNQLSNGEQVILQGFRRLKLLAKANVFGSLLSLIIALPIYYIYGVKGIGPVIFLTSFLTLLISIYYSNKVEVPILSLNIKNIFSEGKQMLSMGFVVGLSSLFTVGAAYFIRIYINRIGGTVEVGLYNAGFAMISTYVGLIFAAMTTDFYPRLAGISYDNNKVKTLINQQAEIAVLILAPLLIFIMTFSKIIIYLLYSSAFTEVNVMILWAAFGMLFKAIAWSIGVLFMAKGARKIFFWSEVIAISYILILNILGYKYFGLEGLGISYLIAYLLLLIQVYFISRIHYNFSFSNGTVKISCVQFSLAFVCLLVNKLSSEHISYFIGTILMIFSLIYSYVKLNKMIGLNNILYNMYNQMFKK